MIKKERQKFMRNKIIILLILFIPMVAFAYLQTKDEPKSLKDELSSATSLAGNLDTKGKLLKFSSPMCSECQEVAKTVSKVMPEYDTVVMEEVNVTDGSEKSDAMIKMYKVSVVPTMIFIDKGGNIVEKTEGAISEDETRAHLDKIK